MVCLVFHFLSEPWFTFCVAVFLLCFSVPCFGFLLKFFKPVFCSQDEIVIPPCEINYSWKAHPVDEAFGLPLDEAFGLPPVQPAPKQQGVTCYSLTFLLFYYSTKLSCNYVCFPIFSFDSFALMRSFLCYLSLTLLKDNTFLRCLEAFGMRASQTVLWKCNLALKTLELTLWKLFWRNCVNFRNADRILSLGVRDFLQNQE